MAYKILENNGVEIENADGGALNNLAAGNKSGVAGNVLNECLISATGNQVIVSPGLLVLHGIRVKITASEIIVISSTPAADTTYQLVAQIAMTSGSVIDFSLFAQTPSALTKNNLFVSGSGIYQIELGRFVHKTDGALAGVTRTAEVIYGGLPDAPANGSYFGRKDGAWATFNVTPYDKVIRTQSEFNALVESSTWLGAVSVAFVGEFTRNAGILIPATVKQIHGFNGAKITITSNAAASFGYQAYLTGAGYEIISLAVSAISTGSSNSGVGFANCANLINCTGKGTCGPGGSSTGFSNCTNLTNCTGIGERGLAVDGTNTGFNLCTNLNNCTGNGYYGAYARGFSNCTNLTNCRGAATDAGISFGFGDCMGLSSCNGTGAGTNYGYGYHTIHRASSCTGAGSSGIWGGTNTRIDDDSCDGR